MYSKCCKPLHINAHAPRPQRQQETYFASAGRRPPALQRYAPQYNSGGAYCGTSYDSGGMSPQAHGHTNGGFSNNNAAYGSSGGNGGGYGSGYKQYPESGNSGYKQYTASSNSSGGYNAGYGSIGSYGGGGYAVGNSSRNARQATHSTSSFSSGSAYSTHGNRWAGVGKA